MNIETFSSPHYSNTYIVHMDEGDIIIDAGAPLDELKPHILNEKVLGIFITHAHFDHIIYLDDYANTFAAPVYISATGKEKLYNAENNLSVQFLGRPLIIKTGSTMSTIKEGDDILGVVTVLELGGHSSCGLGFIIGENIFVGDTLFERGVGRTDFYDSSYAGLISSIRKIYKSIAKNVYPGHGSFFLNKI